MNDTGILGNILGDPGAVSGAGDKVKTGGKKFDEQKVQTKNRSPWGHSTTCPAYVDVN